MNAPMPIAERAFSHVTEWVFDLDNTLYPRSCNLFAQVDELITRYVMRATGLVFEAARELQRGYYRDHGTTLNGLMIHYGIDPDHFLGEVHRLDYSPVMADPALIAAIAALPGRKFIFTNADTSHAEAVLGRLGGSGVFDGVFDIRATGYQPKPLQEAYDSFLSAFDIDPRRAAMFEDLEKNLVVPHAAGMATVHVVPAESFSHAAVESWELSRADGRDHVHHVTEDLVSFLGAVGR